MKLAEALMERKALKTKMEELKKRLYQNAIIQEGDIPIENPVDILGELKEVTLQFEELIKRINNTNISTKMNNGMSLMEAIVRKDMLNYSHLIYINLADKATPKNERYSNREIKCISNVNVSEIRKKADEIAKEYRIMDAKIQEANWTIDLI